MNSIIKANVQWASLETVNEMSGKYQVDLTQLSDGAVQSLEAQGLNVKFKEDRGHFITCKSQRPIYATGAAGDSLRGVPIGNGSEAVAKVGSFAWKFKGKEGMSPSLNNLTITDLQVFDDGAGGEYDDTPINLDEAL
jgi:hypothetical protein